MIKLEERFNKYYNDVEKQILNEGEYNPYYMSEHSVGDEEYERLMSEYKDKIDSFDIEFLTKNPALTNAHLERFPEYGRQLYEFLSNGIKELNSNNVVASKIRKNFYGDDYYGSGDSFHTYLFANNGLAYKPNGGYKKNNSNLGAYLYYGGTISIKNPVITEYRSEFNKTDINGNKFNGFIVSIDKPKLDKNIIYHK